MKKILTILLITFLMVFTISDNSIASVSTEEYRLDFSSEFKFENALKARERVDSTLRIKYGRAILELAEKIEEAVEKGETRIHVPLDSFSSEVTIAGAEYIARFFRKLGFTVFIHRTYGIFSLFASDRIDILW